MPTDPNTPSLIADIGGTNARFALVEAGGDTPVAERTLRCADYPGFAEAAEAYLQSIGSARPTDGLCAIANPVTGDYLKMTNHVWSFSIEATRQQLGFERLRFINDWAAQALAVPHFQEDDLERVGGGEPRTGKPIAVLGPGTGLGVAGLVPAGSGWVPIEGEGGHVTFSPVTEREAAMAAVHRRRFGHCSAERVVSGIGLVANYEALCELDGAAVETLTASEVTRRASEESCAQCREAVEMFCLGLATTASNFAVSIGALGGVYLGGGILPQLGRLFDTAAFRARFEDKGRFGNYLAGVPTYVIHAENPALLGLAKTLGHSND